MLVAEKLRYLEEIEPLAEHAPLRKQPPMKKEELKPSPALKPRIFSNVVSVLMVMVCFGTACFVVSRYAVISENHSKIIELEKTLEQEYDNQGRLKVELAYGDDLSKIEFAATANLGMHYPEEGQVMYVNAPVENKIAKTAEETKVASNSDKSLWKRLLGISN